VRLSKAGGYVAAHELRGGNGERSIWKRDTTDAALRAITMLGYA
jgi:hypothetical protein